MLSEHELSVYNDGPPMTDDRISKLFKAYEKGSDGQFGLGLAIVHKVVTSYGFVPSAFNVDRGVIFKITQKRTRKSNKK